MFYTVIIPKNGEKPYVQECEEYTKSNGEYELTGRDIGISHPKYRIKVLVQSSWTELRHRQVVEAKIYICDGYVRDKYAGMNLESASNIVNQLNNRKWYL